MNDPFPSFVPFLLSFTNSFWKIPNFSLETPNEKKADWDQRELLSASPAFEYLCTNVSQLLKHPKEPWKKCQLFKLQRDSFIENNQKILIEGQKIAIQSKSSG